MTCRHYASLLALAGTQQPLGWPAHLETSEERDGFAFFASEHPETVADMTVNNQPLKKAQSATLLEAIWRVLTLKQRAAWDTKAKARGFASGRAAFNAERIVFVERDLLTNPARYPNDTLLKQIWRNLTKSERQWYMLASGGASSSSSSSSRKTMAEDLSSDDEKEEKAQRPAKRARQTNVPQPVVDATMSYMSRGEIPAEMAMAIINNLPRNAVLATARANKFLHGVAWELLFDRDFKVRARATPEGAAFIAAVLAEAAKQPKHPGTQRADYNWVYHTVSDRLARALTATFMEGLTTANAGDDRVLPERLLFIVDAAADKTLYRGGTVGKPEFNEDVEDRAEQYNVRYAYDLDIEDEKGNRIDYESDPERAKRELAQTMKRELSHEEQMEMMVYFEQVLDRQQIEKYYGQFYTGNSIHLEYNTAAKGAYKRIRDTLGRALEKALANRRFGFGQRPGAIQLTNAVFTFFKAFISQGYPLIELRVITFNPEDKDEDDDSSSYDRKPIRSLQKYLHANLNRRKPGHTYLTVRRVSLLTGAAAVPAPDDTVSDDDVSAAAEYVALA